MPSHSSRRAVKRFIRRRQKSTTDATPKSTISPLIRSRRTQSRLLCLSKFGFWCNPNLPAWNGAKIVLRKMPLSQLFNLFKSSQTAYHNLCTSIPPPTGIGQLLWNGLKFCIEKPLPKPRLDQTFARLERDLRLKHHWSDQDCDADDYDRKLYIKSDWVPDTPTPELDAGLALFKTRICEAVKNNQVGKRRQHNLPTMARSLLQNLPNSLDHIILNTDKNLGPAILERYIYIQRCLHDHLLDQKTYHRMSKEAACHRLHKAELSFKALVNKYRDQKQVSDSDFTYFTRSWQEKRRLPQFYCTPKVHKKPNWKTRPIVSCVNSRMGDLSKWVDVQLQRVVHLCPGYLKDSRSLLKRLKNLGKLPPTAAFVTADATSMYTNIDTDHGLQTLRKWFNLHAHELPAGFPTEMVLEATELVMRNNVFQFDDTFWLQLTGTAMGTSLACMYATIYFSYHEETRILPVYAHQRVMPAAMPAPGALAVPQLLAPALLLHARLIDDAFQIWDTAKLPPEILFYFVDHMISEMKFGILEWEVEQLSQTVDFLDLTITLDADGSVATKTFVKDMNLHLYIPPRSAHPKGILKSLIFGTLQRYWIQNSSQQDFVSAATDFYGHLINRGYSQEDLNPTFLEAGTCIAAKALKGAAAADPWEIPPRSPSNSLFIHWEYHPRDIGRQTVRQIFKETLEPALTESGLTINQLTIAYSTPSSLGSCLTKTQLEEPADARVSSYIESLDATPANL